MCPFCQHVLYKTGRVSRGCLGTPLILFKRISCQQQHVKLYGQDVSPFSDYTRNYSADLAVAPHAQGRTDVNACALLLCVVTS